MTGVITWTFDCGDGVYIGGNTSATNSHNTKTMTSNELTLDQLQAVAGGATAIEYGLIAAAVPKENTGESLSTEAPPSLKKPQDNVAIIWT